MNNDKNKPQEFSVNLRPDIAQGLYSNMAFISHSRSEFTVDFATMLQGFPQPTVLSRIILTPDHAKRLFLALQDNIIKYESQYGSIDTEKKPGNEGGTFNLGGFGPFGGGKKS